MAIRFQCAACCQPIEVDDDWAARPVACPYCRKTITAPRESTLGDSATFGTASGAARAAEPGYSAPPPPVTAEISHESNRLAIVALALAVAALGMFLVGVAVAARHENELKEMQLALGDAPDYARQVKVVNEMLERNPDAAGWITAIGLLLFGWLGTNLAAVVCGIISVRRPVRRGVAIAALAVSFLPLLLLL